VPEWLDLTARCPAAGAGDLNRSYQMRMKAARALYAEVSERYPTMPFSIRGLDQRNVQLGMKVCTLALLAECMHPAGAGPTPARRRVGMEGVDTN